MIQDSKTNTETKKKTQTERILETESMRKWSGTANASIKNRIQEMEERLSNAKDTIKEMDSLVKENIKSNKNLTQNIQEIWDIMERPKYIKYLGEKLQSKEVSYIHKNTDSR